MMILRTMTLVGGVLGAAALSQYPEFAQQYTQRLAGQIQALGGMVRDFDASAMRSGLTRDEALNEMQGTQFLSDRGNDLRRTITRYEDLQDDYERLASANAFQKLLMPQRLGDGETLRGTFADYQPAVPLTPEGGVATAAGFIGGRLAMGGLVWLALLPFRRRPRPEPQFATPNMARVDIVSPDKTDPSISTEHEKGPVQDVPNTTQKPHDRY